MQALELADFGVIGEGEETMCELAHALEADDTDFRQIAGLIYRSAGTLLITAKRPDIKDLDLLPFPDYGVFDIEKIIELSARDGRGGAKYDSAIAIIGSRSCPFHCTFCFHTSGDRYRQRSLDNLFSEIDFLVSRYHIREVLFSDELFAADIVRVKQFCERIATYDIAWSCSLRPNQISPELVSHLKTGRVKMIGLGLESYDDQILKSMRKGITSADIDNALKLLYAGGIPVSGQFIMGDLEETMETALKTLNYCRDHLYYHINLSFIRPFPGTYIYEEAVRRGIITDKLQYLKDGCPQMNISSMSDYEFSEVLRQIDTMYLEQLSEIGDIKLISSDVSAGCVKFSGVCERCNNINVWNDVNIISNGFLFCPVCTQKYNIPAIEEIFNKIDSNIGQLADRHGKIAIWAVTSYVANYISGSSLRCDPRVFLIDTSKSKQQLSMAGVKIYDPSILEKEKIPLVVIGAAAQAGVIESVIRNTYPEVRRVMLLGNLIGDLALNAYA